MPLADIQTVLPKHGCQLSARRSVPHEPAGRRGTWFALMASLMNLALVAGQLQTKYLNWVFAVDRGQYSELPILVVTAVVIGFVAPLAVILLFGRRAT